MVLHVLEISHNSVGMESTSEHWRKMWCLFSLKSEEFRTHYHRRSNVESTMWMIKSKFGAAVRSKHPVSQVNKILAKLVCHNLACIVRAVHEFGIDVDLSRSTPVASGSPTASAAAGAKPSTAMTLTLLPAPQDDEQDSR
jgi:hypothetical protein